MSVLAWKVLRDLTRRRIRTALTLIGIVAGVAGIVAVSATARQLGGAQQELVASPSQPDLTVRTGTIASSTVSLIARQMDATVEGRAVQELSFSASGPWRGSLLIGLPVDAEPTLSAPELISGRMPGAGEVAFDQGVDALANVQIGDLVAFRRAAGAPITYLTVSGFTRTPAALDPGILNRVNAYAPTADVERARGRPGVNQLLVKLSPDTDATFAATKLTRFLDHRGIRHSGVTGQENDLVGTRELRTIIWLLLAFSIIGLTLSGSLVANTIAAIVHDEFRQIGVLKALGASRGTVCAVYLAPALVLGLIGTVAGYAAGVLGGQAIVAYLTGLLGYPLPSIAITGREIGFAAAVGIGVPLAAAALPALVGARLSVTVLLRRYGLAGELRRRRTEPLPRLLGHRWPLLAMAVRNALRRRLRAAMTTALIALAVAAALASQALSSSLEGTVETLYDLYGTDAWITFNTPADASVARHVAREDGVVAAEPWARATGYTAGQSIDLWGVPPSTRLYGHRLTAGRWLRDDEPRAAVASAKLARSLDLAPGDTLPLDIGHETRVVNIIGIVDDESTYLGSTDAGKLFLPPTTLNGVGGGSPQSFLAVAFSRHDPESVEAMLRQLEEQFTHLQPRPYAAYSDKASTDRSIDVLVVLLRAMVALIAGVGFVGVVNTLAMNVAERRQELGVARSLGGTARHVATLVVGEGLLLGCYGFLLGLLAGYPLAALLVYAIGDVLFRLSFTMPPAALAATLGLTLTACVVASAGPALIAARVRPHEVLRYE